MNDYLLSIILGIVEGLTEFLPISSTAHLRIAEALFNVSLESGYWKMYTVVIQLGAILSLPVYFASRIRQFLATFPRGQHSDRTWLTHPLSLTIVAFATTAVPAFLLASFIGAQLESLYVIGASLLLGGIVMWAVDAAHAKAEQAGPQAPASLIRTWHMEDMSLLQAVWIGACQVLAAVFPGTSRSMATIVAGQLAGMSRAAALEFSFFLSIPTMAAAAGYDLLSTLAGARADSAIAEGMDAHAWTVLAIGFVVAFFVAYGSVAWLMAWVRRHGFVPFAIYRIVMGLAILGWAVSLP